MSATLTWFASALGTKTGTAIGNCFADIVTLANATSPGSDFLWEVKGSNTGSTPYYISFGRKDGSAGRIAIIAWSSSPAANNAAILDTTPSSNVLYLAYFPAGTGTTLANLTAASGAITGDDTGCVKVATGAGISSAYPASYQPFYFESEAGIMFGFQNPASSNCLMQGAGDLVVDASDVAYGCTIGYGVSSMSTYASTTSPMLFQSSAILAGNAATPGVRTNYVANNSIYFHAFIPSGAWCNVAGGTNDMMVNTSTKDIYFAPVQLIGQTKGLGAALKLRQIAWGPGTPTSQLFSYTSGATVLARYFNAATAGGVGYPWFTNSKL